MIFFYTTAIIIQPPIFHPVRACPPVNHNWVNIFLCSPSPPFPQLQISNSPTLPPPYNILSLVSRSLHTHIIILCIFVTLCIHAFLSSFLRRLQRIYIYTHNIRQTTSRKIWPFFLLLLYFFCIFFVVMPAAVTHYTWTAIIYARARLVFIAFV